MFSHNKVLRLIDTISGEIEKDSDLNLKDVVKKREKFITSFVDSTVEHHGRRLKTKRVYQHIITIVLLAIVIAFAVSIILTAIFVGKGLLSNVETIITIFASCSVSFVASVFSLLQIIVKYIFPSSEEDNSMRILETTLKYDLDYLRYDMEKATIERDMKKDIAQSDSK